MCFEHGKWSWARVVSEHRQAQADLSHVYTAWPTRLHTTPERTHRMSVHTPVQSPEVPAYVHVWMHSQMSGWTHRRYVDILQERTPKQVLSCPQTDTETACMWAHWPAQTHTPFHGLARGLVQTRTGMDAGLCTHGQVCHKSIYTRAQMCRDPKLVPGMTHTDRCINKTCNSGI